MTYFETLNFLYSRLPMYQRVGPVAMKKDLSNTIALCTQLGNPQERFRSIHIAGTNGKGSVSHMLAAVAQAEGLKTGLYTSPHYKDFRERIKINGQMIGKKTVVDFVQNNLDAIERIRPSFFELTVALAFDCFAKEKVDLAVVEVGLGGRLDSTNVIRPLISVITNIGYDHMDMLGHTLALIAGEKAGIIKPDIPVVVGETHPETAPVFIKKAADCGASIVFADQQVVTDQLPATPSGHSAFKVSLGEKNIGTIQVDSLSPFVEANLKTTVATWAQLPFLSEASLKTGLKNLRSLVNYMGRWQVIAHDPMVLVDSAHNEDGLKKAFQHIRTMSFDNLHIVTGTVNDKDLSKSLPHFPEQARYYFTKPNIPRGLEATQLMEKAAPYGLKGRAYSSVRRALAAARRRAQPDDLIVVIGSVFVAAEVL